MTPTLSNFTFGQRLMRPIMTRCYFLEVRQTNDFEQCLNQLELDLWSFQFCELGPIMARYDFLGATRQVIFSTARSDSKLTLFHFSCEWGPKIATYFTEIRLQLELISLLVNFSCELGPIMTRLRPDECFWAMFNRLQLDQIFLLVNVLPLCELGPITRYDPQALNEWFWAKCSNRLQLDIISHLLSFSAFHIL